MATVMTMIAIATSTGDIPHLGTWPATGKPHRQRLTATVVVCGRRCKMRRAVRPYNRKLNRMANCESGGRWHIATGNGFYGGLQFVPSTWWSVGGRGLPHHATELEQKYRAVLLIRQQGYAPWPVCGYV